MQHISELMPDLLAELRKNFARAHREERQAVPVKRVKKKKEDHNGNG